ncbi:MAG: ComEA family DNA-binding protein [Isosphaeraceae bacterium]
MSPMPRRHPWGWTSAARLALGLLAITASLALSARTGETNPTVASVAPGLVIDPNRVPPAVLESLPRVGPILADRIVQARVSSPLASIGDLESRVRGIGPATATAIRPFLTFEETIGPSASPSP